MLNRLWVRPLSDNTTATADRRLPDPSPPDRGERRLGWIAASIAAGAVVILGATLSTLLPMRDRADASASHEETAAVVIPDASFAGASTPPPGPAVRDSAGHQTAKPVAGAGDVVAPRTLAGTAPGPSRPHATVRPRASATTASRPSTGLPPDVQAAIAAVRAAIQHQIDTGQLDRYAGADLLDKVEQVVRELAEGDWTTAVNYASTMWEKLVKYREEGKLTATGYEVIVSAFNEVRDALANR